MDLSSLSHWHPVILYLNSAPWLDGKHTIFGRVSDGLNVILKMGQVPVDTTGKKRVFYSKINPKWMSNY